MFTRRHMRLSPPTTATEENGDGGGSRNRGQAAGPHAQAALSAGLLARAAGRCARLTCRAARAGYAALSAGLLARAAATRSSHCAYTHNLAPCTYYVLLCLACPNACCTLRFLLHCRLPFTGPRVAALTPHHTLGYSAHSSCLARRPGLALFSSHRPVLRQTLQHRQAGEAEHTH